MHDDTDDDGVDRRRLIRVIVILGVGLPILIEAVTFAGLVSHSLGPGTAATPDATETARSDAVGPDDELLPETGPKEAVTDGYVLAGEDAWRFVLTVSVTEVTGESYELRFGSVETESGRTVDGTATTGSIAPGESGSVTGTWRLPTGQQPAKLTVAVVRGEDGSPAQHVIAVGGFPVRGY